MKTTMLRWVFALLATHGTAVVAAPPDLSTVAVQRERWHEVLKQSLTGSSSERHAALHLIVDEAAVQVSSLRHFDLGRVRSTEGIIAPFCLLPVLIEYAEKASASDDRTIRVAYEATLAGRALRRHWGGDVPSNMTLRWTRRWARGVQAGLPAVSDHLERCRRSLNAY